MKAKTGRGGGKMAPSMLKRGESKTAKPVKAKVLESAGAQGKRLMDKHRKLK